MNKRITSLLLCFVMVFAMLATAVPVFATGGTCTYTIEADKTTAHPGDTIKFTIYMQQTGNQNTLQGELSIPTGLTYVSGDLEDGIRTTLGWDAVEWTPSTMMLTGYGSESFTGTQKVAVLNFQCKVDSDAVIQDYAVKLIDVEADDELYETKHPNSVPATITVTAAPKPATDIKLNKNTLELTVGESQTLVATVEPADTTDTVTWDTGRSDVATVDSTGKVTAVAPGTAVIAARAGEKSAFCTVTVVAAPCTHTYKTYIGEKPSTCTEQGWDAYSRCDNCGQRFDMEGNPISEIPFRALADHTGGTATCTHKAVCTVCGNEYGNLAAHSYTANTKKPEALKTAGTCKDKAIYLRSCEVCGKVAPSEAWGTFYGDTDPNNHAGGTTTVNASEPDHKNQVAGYTGDTKCLGCGEIIAHGTAIAPGEHTPASTWNSDGEYHWKTCTVAGCGVIIDGSKAAHTSTGANVATCQHKAICDVCNVEYGEKAAHNPASGWTSDASGHWHACQTAGCTEKCDFASHTPDHTGHATEEYAIKCTECGYVIEAQLGHTHVFDKEVATDAYKASDATCTAKATYYKSCACGEKGTETFEYGELAPHTWTPATCTAPKTCSVCGATEGDALGHTEGTEWKSDADNHWHVCTVAGCGVVIESSKAAHEFEWKIDKEATATEKGSKHEECKVCGYKKAAVEIPATGTPTDPTEPNQPTEPTKPADTTKPTDTTKPVNTNNSKKSPQTGNESLIGIWIAGLFVCGAGVFGTTIYSRKRRSVK